MIRDINAIYIIIPGIVCMHVDSSHPDILLESNQSNSPHLSHIQLQLHQNFIFQPVMLRLLSWLLPAFVESNGVLSMSSWKIFESSRQVNIIRWNGFLHSVVDLVVHLLFYLYTFGTASLTRAWIAELANTILKLAKLSVFRVQSTPSALLWEM